jgi:hypothetical protein
LLRLCKYLYYIDFSQAHPRGNAMSLGPWGNVSRLSPGSRSLLSQSVNPLIRQCWRAHPNPSRCLTTSEHWKNLTHTNAKRRTDTRWLTVKSQAADVERAMKPAWPCMLSLAIWQSQILPQRTAPPVYLSLALLQHCLWSHLGTLQSLKSLPPRPRD